MPKTLAADGVIHRLGKIADKIDAQLLGKSSVKPLDFDDATFLTMVATRYEKANDLALLCEPTNMPVGADPDSYRDGYAQACESIGRLLDGNHA